MSLTTRLMLRIASLFCVLSLSLSTIATPIPLPLPLMNADYSLSLTSVNRSGPLPRRLSTFPIKPFSSHKRDIDTLSDLYTYSDGANTNANSLRGLAANSASVGNDDYDFQQQYVSGLSDFDSNMKNFQVALAQASSDKGLENYDRQNDLETLLKNVINANKMMLSSTDTVIYNIPGIGPVLGPIVYDVKCIIDALLDATEDMSDAIINSLGPVLQSLLGKASATVCRAGVEVAGLCV